MPDEIEVKFLDKRTVERYLRTGQLDEKTYEKYLKSLDDVGEKGTVVETMMDDADFDEDEDEAGEGAP